MPNKSESEQIIRYKNQTSKNETKIQVKTIDLYKMSR